MANSWFAKGVQHFTEGDIDFLSDDIRAMLVTADYTPDTSATGDEFVSTISAISGAVIARSNALTGKTNTGGVLNVSNFTFSLAPANFIAKYLVIYKATGSDATSPLLITDDTAQGLPKSTDGGDIAVQIDSGPNKLGALGSTS